MTARKHEQSVPNSTEMDAAVGQAASLVAHLGLVLVLPNRRLALPSLWESVVGASEVTVFTVDVRGRRTLSVEIDRVWRIKNHLAARRLACVGEHVGARLTAVSPGLLSSLYALTGRTGRADDFREPGLLPGPDREIAEALFQVGPATLPDLRRLLGRTDARATKQAIKRLQRALVVTQAGEADQKQGWAAAIFDLVARRYQDRLRRLPAVDDAQSALVKAVLATVGETTPGHIASLFGLSRTLATALLDRIAGEGDARCVREGGVNLWRHTRR